MNELKLKNNWKLISSEKLKSFGKEISNKQFDVSDWHSTNIPSTVLETLVKNGVYKEPYFGTNLIDIPTEQFKSPWWYRTEFDLTSDQVNSTVLISFEGINYKANIWLNGTIISDAENVNGAYRQFQFNISKNLLDGKNILAVEVIPPKPGDFTIGFVDWNPNPPDNNVGIYRDVTLHFNNGVSFQNLYVESKIDLETLNNADLTISTDIVNHTQETFIGVVKGEIENIEFSKSVNLEPNETKSIKFISDEFPQLKFEDPKLWWPNQLGEPNLYNLKLLCADGEVIIDELETTFGIREIEDYVNDGGHRGYKVNGHKVLIRGAGWTDDLLLQDTHESLEAQIQYVKHMNLNCIRLEGFWGKDQKLYDLCDENGILIMVGWSCQWEHEEYLGKPIDERYGGVIEPDEIELISKSFEDQLLWLRNHPSIFVWTVGSDLLPHPDLEKKYIDIFNKYDRTRSYLNSTGGIGSEQGIISNTEIVSEISGSSRVKMLGPYAYTPPIYWYTNKNLGGAYGFNTETCPGANISPIESLRKMIPEKNLWPIDDVWNYHCGKNSFGHIGRTQIAIEKRYGKPVSAEDFAYKAQVLNYELMRPMFEAFQANQKKATGIIQWMLNSAWPEMYWQLYDTYLMPNAAYYGTRKANEPLHLLYNYGNNSVEVVNNTLNNVENYKALIRILDINSKEVINKSIDVNIEAESSTLLFKLPELNNLSSTYFLDLRLIDKDNLEIGNNFYWLSTKEDVLDYDFEFEDWPYHTPSKEYADFNLLSKLPNISLDVVSKFEVFENKNKLTVTIENKNNIIAFFVELLLFDKKTDEVLLPVIWRDNYISLLPNEKRIIEAEYSLDKDSEQPELKIKGWNLI
ncbi:MAG: glycoside hydrolase family 2 [Ignavibacteriae bacterium]|nr:glycoside hydrolase family 2 [Ignavibacteriota bacterium]